MSNNETLLTKAYHNLRCAEDIYKMEEGDEAFLNYCGYHLQQAVELSIKYTLEINGITPPFVHEIEQLIYLAKENNVDLFLTDYISDHAEMFSSWEAKTRYVLNFKLEKEKIKTAMKEVNNYLDKLTYEHEKYYYNNLKETLNNNINILLNDVEKDLNNINWENSLENLENKIEEKFDYNIKLFIEGNENQIDEYLKVIPDTYKKDNLNNKQMLSDFLSDKITDKFGKIEDIINTKHEEEGEDLN